MPQRPTQSPHLIYSPGTQVVSLVPVLGENGKPKHPAGVVGVVLKSPTSRREPYRVRFTDGYEQLLAPDELVQLAVYKQGEIGDPQQMRDECNLFERVILKVVVGSRAFGLADEDSDTDLRGVYLPPAHLHWSLYCVPEQIEHDATQEVYWELQKFLALALKANPNVLETLYSPVIVIATDLGQELLDLREAFLSRLVFQTFNGYVMSQFKKMQADIRNQGTVKWKHVMHLLRLLMSGIHVLRTGEIAIDVGDQRDRLLSIKRGEAPWEETEAWRLALHREFEEAATQSRLPDRPDYEKVNQFLVKARMSALGSGLP